MKIKSAVDKYFLETSNSFSGRRKLKKTVLIGVPLGFLLVLTLGVLVFADVTEKSHDTKTSLASKQDEISADIPKFTKHVVPQELETRSVNAEKYLQRSPSSQTSSEKAQRQYSASQVIRRGDSETSADTDKLPIGTTFRVVLTNRVVSSDQTSPVIAEIPDGAYFENVNLIPEGSKALAQSSLDDTSKRLQVRFHTVVFPDGSQHPIGGLGLQPDGSSGVPGDFHSGNAAKQTGRFLGKLAGGVAQGMKERQAAGLSGAYEVGSIRNGVLNGISETAFDQADQEAESMKSTQGYLEVPPGTPFLLYCEREFKP